MNKTQVYIKARMDNASTPKTREYWAGLLVTPPAWLIKQVESGKRTLADATPEGKKAKSRSLRAKKAAKTRKANKKQSKKQTRTQSPKNTPSQVLTTTISMDMPSEGIMGLKHASKAITWMGKNVTLKSRKAFNKSVWGRKNAPKYVKEFLAEYRRMPDITGANNLYRNVKNTKQGV